MHKSQSSLSNPLCLSADLVELQQQHRAGNSRYGGRRRQHAAQRADSTNLVHFLELVSLAEETFNVSKEAAGKQLRAPLSVLPVPMKAIPLRMALIWHYIRARLDTGILNSLAPNMKAHEACCRGF